MTRLRAAIGPVLIGIAAWCAAGHVSVASTSSATARLAAPASLWWLVLGACAAACVPAWRRAPAFAAPALVATWPWWPVPVPAAALIFTGPMAWLPIGLALVAPWLTRLAHAPRGSETAPLPAIPQTSWREPLAAGALTLALAGLAAWCAAPRVPGGDEPSYLLITQSLLKDGDLKIENNHAARDYAPYYPGDLPLDYLKRSVDGQIYSIHAPGTAVLVLPAFALGGYRGAEWTILLVAALTGALVWRMAWLVTGLRDAAWFTWAAVAGSATFLAQSFTIFPDAPGALAVALGVWLLASVPTAGTASLAGVSIALAALPWLHTRFVVLAAGLGALIVWRVWTTTAIAAARIRRLAWFLAVPAVSAIAWFAFFKIVYGTFNPAAPYGDTSGPDGTHLRYMPGGLVALLLDEQYGLLAYAPVLACALLGLFTRGRRTGALARASAIVGLAYLALSATYWMWWAGVPAPPARFAMAVLPIVAAPLALAWARAGERTRPVMVVLLAVSWAISAIVFGVDRASLLWNDHTAWARWLQWLGPVVALSRGWPSFFWRLTPGVASTEWPFVLHAGVALGIFVGLWLLIAMVGDRRRWTGERWAVASAWWMLAAVGLAVQCGWWITRAETLDPSASQSAMLVAAASGRPVFAVNAWSVRRVHGLPEALHIDGGIPAGRVWARFGTLPAATYDARITTTSAGTGEWRLAIGSADVAPLRRIPRLPMRSQTLTLSLPAPVAGLTLTGDAADPGARVELSPVAFAAESADVRSPAVRAASFGGVDVYFRDDHVFVENDGFWVKGGQAASFVLVPPIASSAASMTLTNGASPNALRLTVDGADRSMPLEAGESRAVMLTATRPHGPVRVTLASPAGFRPSDAGAADRRFLGVRVGLGPAPPRQRP